MENKAKLTPELRMVIAQSESTTSELCKMYGVTRQTVLNCRRAYPELSGCKLPKQDGHDLYIKERRRLAMKPGKKLTGKDIDQVVDLSTNVRIIELKIKGKNV